MRNKVIWSFLSLMALGTSGLVAGCDSDAKIAKSSSGESCNSSADCNEGLKCYDGACYKPGSIIDSNNGGEASTGGTPGVVVVPPNLGKLGESCTKRADCEDGLACLSQRCSEDTATGAGGEGTGGPTLGGPGETCGLTSDCADGLKCLPNGYSITDLKAKAIGSNTVGVCTAIDTGIVPTGKVCGAECAVAADCCELPIARQAGLGAYSCSDLAALVADVPNCDIATGVNGAICLAYNAYCDEQCGKNTWACDAGRCQYTAKCTKATEVVGGCPGYTRGGWQISPCNVKTSKCEPVVTAVAGCTSDAKCNAPTPMVIADGNGDTCSAGECACDVATGGCYRKCSEDIDCPSYPSHHRCDTKTSLCVAVDSCTTDLQCVVAYRDPRAACAKGVCVAPPCEHDIDCNPYGLVNNEFRSVCGPDKQCVELAGQCASDDECGPYTLSGLAGNVRSFCTEPSTTTTAALPVSAITD